MQSNLESDLRVENAEEVEPDNTAAPSGPVELNLSQLREVAGGVRLTSPNGTW